MITEAMKMETAIEARFDGEVARICVFRRHYFVW